MRRALVLIPLLAFAPRPARADALPVGMPRAIAVADTSMMPALDPMLGEVIREEPVLDFLAPEALRSQDWTLEWAGEPIRGVRASIEDGSVQWVRVHDVLRIPRGRLWLRVDDADGGTVSEGGFVQALATDTDAPSPAAKAARMLIALVSGDANPIRVRVDRGGKQETGWLRLRFAPTRRRDDGRVYVDVTCSPYGVRAESMGARDNEWAYVGCRMATARATTHWTSSLELVVFWDGVGPSITIDGSPQESGGAQTWSLRASAYPGEVDLRAGEHWLELRYAIPDSPHFASFGAGIGPYFDSFLDQGVDTQRQQRFEPLITLYGSYKLTPDARVVYFNATPARARAYSDTGVYVQYLTAEGLDRRIAINVFLGGHLLWFQSRGKIYWRPGAPQGAEITWRDAGGQGKNAVLGALLNPGIGGVSYYNAWLRFGPARWFVEVNYIAWDEPKNATTGGATNGDRIDLKSIGVSFGMPLIHFL